LYPTTRLVAVPITKMNGIDPNLGLSQNRVTEGRCSTGLDLVIPCQWLQIELPPDCMRIQYKIGPCVCTWTSCGCGICPDGRILNRYSKPSKPLAIVGVAPDAWNASIIQIYSSSEPNCHTSNVNGQSVLPSMANNSQHPC